MSYTQTNHSVNGMLGWIILLSNAVIVKIAFIYDPAWYYLMFLTIPLLMPVWRKRLLNRDR